MSRARSISRLRRSTVWMSPRIPSTRGIFSTAACAVAIPFQSTAGADGSGAAGVGDGSGST
jgi:hypothetical protein